MIAPSEIVRTTLDAYGREGLPHAGVYILAYMGRVVYVGKSECGVEDRLRQHMGSETPLGAWMQCNSDWENIRLDVLTPPGDGAHNWTREAEAACVCRFRPLLNEQLNS